MLSALTLAHPQFQSLLKAFKSEALSFEDLLTGTSEARRHYMQQSALI
jgi:hypothetical protein